MNDPVDSSVPLEAILCTEDLQRRPFRSPDNEAENRALTALARALVDSENEVPQVRLQGLSRILAEKILEVTQCDSSGLSLLTKDDGGKNFHWPAIAGVWKPERTPREWSPGGDALNGNCALLFRHFERRYVLFQSVMPAAEECLIVPFYIDGTAVGTMWAVLHSDRRKFDAEDVRIMTALGDFGALAYQTLESLHDLEVQLAASEEKLRRLATGAEQRARSMIDNALDAVVAMNAEGVITDWNQQAEATFGWNRDEALGKLMSQTIIPEQDRPGHETGLRHFLKTGEHAILNRRIELTALRRNGEKFPVELTVSALQASESWGFHAFVRDITGRKTAEAALLASERSLRSIIDTIPTLAWSAAADGSVDFLNRRWHEFTGLSAEQAHGVGWSDAIHPDDANGLLDYWRAALASGTPVDVEARMRRFDGAYRWFLFRASPLRDQSGRILKWYGTNIDIGDRKQADEALRNTQARLTRAMQVATSGELSASIAHEVNQPLAAVVASANACVRFLSAQPPNLAAAREAAESIVRDGKDAAEVVRRVRALFKRAVVEKSMVDVNDIIGEVLRLLADDIAKRRVSVEIDLWKNSPLVSGDRVQLQQVIHNLLLNGIEAMDSVTDRPRSLWVRSKPGGPQQVQVEVRDNGVGLKDADKIFEAFFTTKESGMGMGLAICRSIIEAHHGQLWAAAHEGPGATFCLALPVQASAE